MSEFKSMYIHALGQFDHEKTDLLDVMGISKERADSIRQKIMSVVDSKKWDGSNSEMLQQMLYKIEPTNVKETLLLGYMVGVIKQVHEEWIDYQVSAAENQMEDPQNY